MSVMKEKFEVEVDKIINKANPFYINYDSIIVNELACIYEDIKKALDKYAILKEVISRVDDLYEDKFFGEILEDCLYLDEDFEDKMYILQEIEKAFDDTLE